MFVTIDTIETSYASSSSGPGAGELEAQELVASLSNYRKKLGRTESTLLNSLVNLLPELSELRGNLKQRNRLIIELKHEVEARCSELDNVRTQLVMLRADFKEYRDQVAKDRKEQEEEAKIAPAKEKNKKDVEQSQLRKKIKQENVEEAEEATSSKLPTAKEKQKMKKNNNKDEEESQVGMRIKHEIVAVEEAEEATRNLAHKTNVKAKDREMQVIKHKRIKQEIVEEEPEPSLLEEPVRKKKNNDEEPMYCPPTRKRIKREVMELGEEESSQPTSSNTLAPQLLVPPQVPPPFFGQAIHQQQPLFFFQTPPILINGRNIYPSMPMPPFPLQQQQQPLPPPMPLAKVKIPKVVTQKRKKRAKRKGKKVTLKDPNKVTPKKKGGPPKTYKVQSGMFKGAFAQMKKHRDKQTTLYKEALIEFEQQPKQNNRKKLRCLVAKMVQKDWDGFWSEL